MVEPSLLTESEVRNRRFMWNKMCWLCMSSTYLWVWEVMCVCVEVVNSMSVELQSITISVFWLLQSCAISEIGPFHQEPQVGTLGHTAGIECACSNQSMWLRNFSYLALTHSMRQSLVVTSWMVHLRVRDASVCMRYVWSVSMLGGCKCMFWCMGVKFSIKMLMIAFCKVKLWFLFCFVSFSFC